VIVGGGFGGLATARALAGASNVDITLIHRTNYHVFQPLLYQVATTGTSLDATLFYSNRRPEDAAYLRELCVLTSHVPGFRCIPTMTRTRDSRAAWTGETARLGVPMLERHLPAVRGPRYYLSGSTTFISGLCQEIERAGVPGSDIRIEMYTGY
jgi:ferredoxin-NADP reductase